MLISNKKIAIVGGGPGGLTLARLLQMKGADVKVYERDLNKDVRVQGATLDLHHESGLAALRAAGLMAEFQANYRPGADAVRIVDKTGAVIIDENIDAKNATFESEYFRPEIDRGPLRSILLSSLQPGTVVWDSHFSSLTKVDGSWKLIFQNETSAYADIVIAADGANSRIRPYLTPIKSFYVGMTAVEGAVYDSENAAPRIHKLLNGGKIFAFGDDKSLIVSSKGDGSLAFYPGFKTTEDWVFNSGIDFKNKEQVLSWFRQEYAGWDSIWLELFENTAYMVPRPQYCMPLDQVWEAQPDLTMLGDAAHLMPPYAGEGVNMAMLDALELSVALTATSEYPDVRNAIASYEYNMRARAAEAARMTLYSTEMLHSQEAIHFMGEVVK